MSNNFQAELRLLGITSSPAFICAPEDRALLDWLHFYNEQWLIERQGSYSPSQVRWDLLVTLEVA